MKKPYLILVLLVAGIGITGLLMQINKPVSPTVMLENFRDGDLVFQTSGSRQSMAIQLATHSPYSHCGLLFQQDGEWWVYEAVQPVGICPLNEWVRRGKEGRYVVKRLKDQHLLKGKKDTLIALASSFKGKDYDPWFGWDDERIYCSELLWKIFFRGAGIRLGELQTLGSLDLSAPQVQEIMYERYGTKTPLNDSLITPVAIFKSPLLKTVFANGEWIRND
jgi:hypothetical protein